MIVKLLKVFINYCYFVIDLESGKCLVIDPAWNMNSILKILTSESILPASILLTHHHFDHTNLADQLSKKYDIPVYMSKKEIDYYGFMCNNLIPFTDDYEFESGGIAVKAYLTPGHTKGGACYLADGFFFTGDTLFIEGCGACSFGGGDPVEMFHSLEKIKRIATGDTIVYPSHSYGRQPGLSFADVLKRNIYLQIDDKDQFVKYRMRKNQSGWYNFQ
jgi:hydroxyacylglutathione hydrolase